MREDARTRGRRLLVEGRLAVQHVDANTVEASCRGDSGEVYRLGFRPDVGWWCDCPAMRRCAHVSALMLVTLRPIGLESLLAHEEAR